MPRLDDDGSTLTLDLHGARVDDAEDLAEAAIIEAAHRGRSTVRLIHGTSTTDTGPHRRTIKTTLHAMLDEGVFAPYITSAFQSDGHLLLGIATTHPPDPERLTLNDLF